MTIDESVLEDAQRIEAGDPGDMLRAVASSAAQVRESAAAAHEAGIARLADEGRPRSVVVLGMGGSGISGDVFAALAGPESPVPVFVHKGYGLPRWIGAADLVVAVSCSGGTEETLSALEAAVRRGCRTLVIGAANSPVAELANAGRALFVPVDARGRQPRSMMWGLSTPLAIAADALGLAEIPQGEIEATAMRLEEIATVCRPDSDSFVNPGKTLALALADRLAMTWGTTDIANVAAYRMLCQLAENAKLPGIAGNLPEANHNQVVAFDGPAGGGSAEDIFNDPDEGGSTGQKLRLVLLRDHADEHPQVTRRADVSEVIAQDRGVAVTALKAEGVSRFERLASLVAPIDYATVYLALLLGLDPTPVVAIQDLKARIAV
ncbi:MAG: glucose/mannose-6-phosphate isomerase [Frankiaceae bacterium]|nr:glucose/mannose-6-phosphate isomerase [Frankiaceae bacterium]MDQ1650135.1 glucose/mannose-6-phosphate isomerase [Frankiaceae bacterium]